jgi:cytochrome c nitrite reductase small subunit
MKKLILWLIPPAGWKVPVIILLGAMVGLFAYSFYTSRAYSYLSDDPKTCVNCHIMAPQYSTWAHSAHREITDCNACHVPHDNVFRKYYFKAKDGLRHATIFTLRAEPQAIMIKEEGIEVVQENCIRCHSSLITDNNVLQKTDQYHHKFEDRLCWECHRYTPHGKERSLSSTPFARVPTPESPVPDWLDEMMEDENQKK